MKIFMPHTTVADKRQPLTFTQFCMLWNIWTFNVAFERSTPNNDLGDEVCEIRDLKDAEQKLYPCVQMDFQSFLS